MARDRETDFKLIAMDWVPVHFWGQEIQKHIDECVEAVEDLIFELQISQFDAMIDNDRDYFKDIKY
jgi:DNA mismatch endonuclease (patch repair protein)